jgi:ferredoxin-NADP reductase
MLLNIPRNQKKSQERREYVSVSMMQFFEVTVIESSRDGTDILVLKTEKPSEFQFQPGQYIVMNLMVNGTESLKPFSIASSPTKNYLEFATKNTGSDFKKAWEQLCIGEKIKITKPRGAFVLDETAGEILLLSGGIGITPLKSMLEYAVDKKLKNRITLLYSNKIPEDIPFLSELSAMHTQLITVTLTITQPEESKQSTTGYRIGRIDAALISAYATDKTLYYICGPPGMVDALEVLLSEMKVDPSRIRKELFTGYIRGGYNGITRMDHSTG